MYRPAEMDQPTSIDCVPTTGSLICDQATCGLKRPTPRSLRAATGDFSGGISYIAMTGATVKVAGVKTEARFGLGRGAVSEIAPGGRSFGISIWTGVTRYTDRRTGTFVGGHTIYIYWYSVWPGGDVCGCEKRSSARHAEFSVEDPGTFSAGYRPWSADLVYRAAEERTRRDGRSGINVLVGPDTTRVRRKVIRSGFIHTKPSTSVAQIAALNVGSIVNLRGTTQGTRWRRSDGTYSNGWWVASLSNLRIGFIRGDKIGTVNVS